MMGRRRALAKAKRRFKFSLDSAKAHALLDLAPLAEASGNLSKLIPHNVSYLGLQITYL